MNLYLPREILGKIGVGSVLVWAVLAGAIFTALTTVGLLSSGYRYALVQGSFSTVVSFLASMSLVAADTVGFPGTWTRCRNTGGRLDGVFVS